MKICVYGASGDRLRQEYFDAAYALGALMAENGHSLIYGGGQTGLMGAVGRGAHDKGGEIIGVAPKFFDEPGVLAPDCTEFIFTETMRERKHIMEDMADAFIILPGGTSGQIFAPSPAISRAKSKAGKTVVTMLSPSPPVSYAPPPHAHRESVSAHNVSTNNTFFI